MFAVVLMFQVTEIETTKHRFLLSLKRTDVQSRKGDPLSAIQHVNSYLLERHVIDDSTLQLQGVTNRLSSAILIYVRVWFTDTASLFSSISWGTVVRGKVGKQLEQSYFLNAKIQ